MTLQTLTPTTEDTAELQEKSNAGRPPKYPVPPTFDQLTMIDQRIVDYFAMDGLMPNYEGSGEKGRMIQLPAQKFAETIGYANRQSLYDRRDAIPNFDDIVLGRMPALYRRYMVTAVWKGVGLRGMRGDAKQAEMLLSHYAGYVPPAQRHEVKIDGLAEAVNAARTAARNASAIPAEEGEIVPDPKVANSIPLPTVSPQPVQNSVDREQSIAAIAAIMSPPATVESKLKPDLVDIAPPNVNKPAGNVMPMETPPAVNVMSNVAPPAPVSSPLQNKVTPDKSVDELDEFGDPITIREFD